MTPRLFLRHVVKFAIGSALGLFAGTCLATEPTLTLQRDGQPIPLAPGDCKRIIQKTEALVQSANFNSLDHPAGFNERPIAEVSKDSFLRVHYEAPITFATVGGTLAAADIWIEIRHDCTLPGPTCLANDGKFAWLGKESGTLTIGLALDPSIYPHLPKQMQKNAEAGRKVYEAFLREGK